VTLTLLSSDVVIKDLAFLPFSPIVSYCFAIFSIQNITAVTIKFLRKMPGYYYYTLDFFIVINTNYILQ